MTKPVIFLPFRRKIFLNSISVFVFLFVRHKPFILTPKGPTYCINS
jgi:hypothetical protein